MDGDPSFKSFGCGPPGSNSRKSLTGRSYDVGKLLTMSKDDYSSQIVPPKSPSQDSSKQSRGSQLGNQLFKAVFEENTASGFNGNCQQQNKNVEILEDITIPSTAIHSEMEEDLRSISSLEEEFKEVKNKKRTFKGDVKIDLSRCQFKNLDNNVNNSNKFSLLGDLDLEPEISYTNTNIENNDNNTKLNQSRKTQVKARSSFCPPIFLENINVKSLVDQLNLKKVEFQIRNQTKNKSKLYLKDASAHSEMMQILRDRNIASYSYTPKEFRRQNVICRGLFYKTDIAVIKSEIDNIIPDTVDSVSKFSTEFSRKHGIDTGLFLVVLKQNRNIRELLGIKCILNQVVTWERPKTSTKVPQCWRCQKWGHYSKNCSRPFACMKCADKHAPGECSSVMDKDALPFCVNCHEKGHTSNYRGCPAYKKYISVRKTNALEAINRKVSATSNVAKAVHQSNIVTADKSFASFFKNSNEVSTRHGSEKPSFIQEFLKVAQAIYGPEPLTLEDKIKHFMKNYKNMSKEQAKNECLDLVREVQKIYGP